MVGGLCVSLCLCVSLVGLNIPSELLEIGFAPGVSAAQVPIFGSVGQPPQRLSASSASHTN